MASRARIAADLRVVRWAAMLFLVADSTDVVVGLFAPSSVVPRSSAMDLLQTALGLVVCGCLLWRRWAWAAAGTAGVVLLMMSRHPVGIEANLPIVAAAALAVSMPLRQAMTGLVGCLGFAVVLGFSIDRASEISWWQPAVFVALLVAVATTGGAVARRMRLEREDARQALVHLQAENRRIRSEQRHSLAAELETCLAQDFAVLRRTAAPVASSSALVSADQLSRTLVAVGEQSRAALASMRVVLHVLRAALEPARAPARRAWAWIDVLESRRGRFVLGALFAGLAVLVLAYAVRAGPAVADAVAVGAPLSVLVALWRLRFGVPVAVVVLLAGLATPRPSLWLVVPAALLAVVAARSGRWHWVATVVVAQLCYMAAQLALRGAQAQALVGALEVVGIASLLLGLTLGHFENDRNLHRTELVQLHDQRGRIAAEERAVVARELHDVVGHQLSLISLQSLAAEHEKDRSCLADRLDRVRDALETGESEIADLLGTLHSATEAVPRNNQALMPTVVAGELARRLAEHDFVPRCTIDPRVDVLDPTTQRTVSRILTESATNVLRHAPSGARCSFSATIEEETLTFVARSPLADSKALPHLSGGYGLRGIRERVDLTGGSFFAGSRDGSWLVQVRMQIGSDVLAAGAVASPTSPV